MAQCAYYAATPVPCLSIGAFETCPTRRSGIGQRRLRRRSGAPARPWMAASRPRSRPYCPRPHGGWSLQSRSAGAGASWPASRCLRPPPARQQRLSAAARSRTLSRRRRRRTMWRPSRSGMRVRPQPTPMLMCTGRSARPDWPCRRRVPFGRCFGYVHGTLGLARSWRSRAGGRRDGQQGRPGRGAGSLVSSCLAQSFTPAVLAWPARRPAPGRGARRRPGVSRSPRR